MFCVNAVWTWRDETRTSTFHYRRLRGMNSSYRSTSCPHFNKVHRMGWDTNEPGVRGGNLVKELNFNLVSTFHLIVIITASFAIIRLHQPTAWKPRTCRCGAGLARPRATMQIAQNRWVFIRGRGLQNDGSLGTLSVETWSHSVKLNILLQVLLKLFFRRASKYVIYCKKCMLWCGISNAAWRIVCPVCVGPLS